MRKKDSRQLPSCTFESDMTSHQVEMNYSSVNKTGGKMAAKQTKQLMYRRYNVQTDSVYAECVKLDSLDTQDKADFYTFSTQMDSCGVFWGEFVE